MKLFAAIAVASFGIPAPGLAEVPQAAHIARIEADLQSPVHIRGRPIKKHTIQEELTAHHTPSVSLAVVDRGRIIWAKAYGEADVAANRPATTRTLYQAGSVSKPVAASGAMRLIEQGRLKLDVPVNRELTSWQIPENPFTTTHPVTLRELLTHTAGTTVHGFPGYAAGAPVPTVVQVLEGKPPANTPPVVVEHEPGSIWNYSGGGITIAQLTMTDVTHEPFPILMRRLVFAPVGMADSTYEQPLPPSRTASAASGYLRNGAPVEGRFHTYPEMAAAGLWTTPRDLAKWAIALEHAYNGGPSRLMSTAAAKQMLTPGLGHWGLGVEVDGSGEDFRFTHGGDDWGFKANLVAWPKGERAIVAMANGDDGMAVVVELMQAVAREYGWKGFESQPLEAVSLTPVDISQMVGRYGHGLAVVSAEGADLFISYQGQRVELVCVKHDQCIADPGGANVGVQLGRTTEGQVKTLFALGLALARDP